MSAYGVKNLLESIQVFFVMNEATFLSRALLSPLHTDTQSRTAIWKPWTNLITDLPSHWRTVSLMYWLLSDSTEWWGTPSGSVKTKTRTWLAQCTLHHRDLASMTSWAVTEWGDLTCHSLELNRKRKEANSQRNLPSHNPLTRQRVLFMWCYV